MLGNPGAPTIPRPVPEIDYDAEHEDAEPDPGWRPALPSPCLRVLQTPTPRECPLDCPGRQPDGSCLTEIVRAAAAAGIEWTFELDKDGRWVYAGPSINEPEAFVPAVSNDLAPTDSGYGSAWKVSNYLDASDVRFTGTLSECERFIAENVS